MAEAHGIDVARDVLDALWSPVVAVTTAHDGVANGLISTTAVTASLLPEAPRVVVVLSKANLTHDLVAASGVFAVHLLPRDGSLEIVRALGLRSGHEEDKLASVETVSGATGSPILSDALAYVEARVCAALDGEDVTVFLADVVAAARLREGEILTAEALRAQMPAEWAAELERNLERQLVDARRRRNVPA